MMGLTGSSRAAVLAFRPAPVQISYLGYPGTMGADYIDYIIADRVIIPEEQRGHFSESAVYLPDTFMASDRSRKIAERTPSREEVGLPDQGFVFCSFNNSYKITPSVFAVWMRLLCEIPESVLWLLGPSAAAVRNLQHEAESAGIDARRLVFAPHARVDDHLARHRLADLFLDTLPCNAHTTANDALWAGLPVLTCMGSAFAGRVAASLLSAAGIPELITESLEQYENTALKLARDRGLLSAIKAKLARNRDAVPLFDTDLFRRNIEAAYQAMWQRAQRGEQAASFAVAAPTGRLPDVT
jgi:protein O-GlcNAc transferase